MKRVPPEFRVRRKGDPDPCETCDGGRCRVCSWGMVWEPSWVVEGANRTGTITQKPCPHGCVQPSATYYVLNETTATA